MTLNTSDRKSIRAAEKAAALADKQRGEVVVNLMSTIPGRKYIWDKLSVAGIFATTFSTDALQMSFNEGQRNQGLVLLNDVIEYCPEQFIEAMREANGRRSESSTADSAGPASESDGGERSSGEDAGGSVEGIGDA